MQSGWFAQVAKNGHVSFKNNELHAHTQQQNMYFLGMGPLPPLPFVTIPPHTLPNPVLSYSKKPSMTRKARVCVGRNFSSDWGDMRNLAFIATTILNFGLV